MNYYQELTILPDPEINVYFIWSKLFYHVHIAIVESAKQKYGENANESDIGVSFPEYTCELDTEKPKCFLGAKLRIFAHTKEELENFSLVAKLEQYNLLDYIHVKQIADVKSRDNNVTFGRFHRDHSLVSITKRRSKRKGETFDEAKYQIIKRFSVSNSISLEEAKRSYLQPNKPVFPFINMKSKNITFPLEIKLNKSEQAVTGTFNTYGLSNSTTVPHW